VERQSEQEAKKNTSLPSSKNSGAKGSFEGEREKFILRVL